VFDTSNIQIKGDSDCNNEKNVKKLKKPVLKVKQVNNYPSKN